MATVFTNNSLGAVGLDTTDDGHVVIGAIGGSATLTPDYYGAQIAQIYADAGLGVVVTGDAPVNTAAPDVTGDAVVGVTLESDTGDWDGSEPIEFAYQWQQSEDGATGWSDIPDADTNELELLVGMVDEYVQCVVTASNEFGSATAESNVIGPIEAE